MLAFTEHPLAAVGTKTAPAADLLPARTDRESAGRNRSVSDVDTIAECGLHGGVLVGMTLGLDVRDQALGVELGLSPVSAGLTP